MPNRLAGPSHGPKQLIIRIPPELWEQIRVKLKKSNLELRKVGEDLWRSWVNDGIDPSTRKSKTPSQTKNTSARP